MNEEVLKAIGALYDPQSRKDAIRDANAFLIQVSQSKEAESICSWILGVNTRSDREIFWASSTYSRMKTIQNIQQLCVYAVIYVHKDVVHRHLCLAIARQIDRQQNISVRNMFAGKRNTLATCLRVLANTNVNTNVNEDVVFARSVYMRCICPSIPLPSYVPVLEPLAKRPLQEALETMSKYFPSFESIPEPLLRACLAQIEQGNETASSAIALALKSKVMSRRRDVSHVITACTKRCDMSSIRVAAACVPYSTNMQLVRILMDGFSRPESSIAMSEIALDAMVRQADRDDEMKLKTVWSHPDVWKGMFTRILSRAQIRDEDDEDEFDRYRRAYLRDASERSCSALGLSETLRRIYRLVCMTNKTNWRVVESALFLLWCVSYEISKHIHKCDELVQLLDSVVRIDSRGVDLRFVQMVCTVMGSLSRWLGTNAKDLLCNKLLIWIMNHTTRSVETAEYAAKTLGSWTCNQTCLDALCHTRSRDIVPALRVAMNMKDLEETSRARVVESAARIVGHTMKKNEALSLLLLNDFAVGPTMQNINSSSPSLLQALKVESDPKRLRMRLALLAVFLQKLREPKLCVAVLSTNSTWNTVLQSLRHESQDVVEGSCKLITASLRACSEHISPNELGHIGKNVVEAICLRNLGCLIRVVTTMFEIHGRSLNSSSSSSSSSSLVNERSNVSHQVGKETTRVVTNIMIKTNSTIQELLSPLLALMCCMDTTCPEILYREAEPLRSVLQIVMCSLRSKDVVSQRSISGTIFSWLAVVSYASCKDLSSKLRDTLQEQARNLFVSMFQSFVHAPIITIPRAAETIGLLLVSLGSKPIVMSWIANILRGVDSSSGNMFLQSLNRLGPCYDVSRKCKNSGNVRALMKLFHDFVMESVHGKGGIGFDCVVKVGEYDDFSEDIM